MAEANGGYLTREQILGAQDIKFEDLDVPEWGGRIRVRGLGGDEMVQFWGEPTVGGDGEVKLQMRMKVGVYPRLVSKSVVDLNGNQMFTEQDVKALGQRSFSALARVVTKVFELSGMTEEAAAEVGKALEPTQADNSSSA